MARVGSRVHDAQGADADVQEHRQQDSAGRRDLGPSGEDEMRNCDAVTAMLLAPVQRELAALEGAQRLRAQLDVAAVLQHLYGVGSGRR